MLGCDQPLANGENILKKMADTLIHRGPDDQGIWFDPKARVGLAHRRLAIIDLSYEGHQPMFSETGRFIIVYNGEVYNFREMKKELENLGHRFRGQSDTEVILAAIEQWGIPESLRRFVGMFAFAVWDRKEKYLYLVRDRLGIKPLYYGWCKNTLIFSSELKAIAAYPGFDGEINRDAIALYLRHSYIPAPFSIYEKICKLTPGCYLKISAPSTESQNNPQAFWSARKVIQEGMAGPFPGKIEEASEHLEYLLKDAVRLRMIADVPLGAFLSGGIDSSLVVSLMQAQSNRPIKTFTIGFKEWGYNEAVQAEKVARHLRTDHRELYLTSQEALAVVPKLPDLYDEPFADSSQIPTFLVSEMAKKEVTVSLSGDGGDELFGGYDRYSWGRQIWKTVGWCPLRIRRWLAQGLQFSNLLPWDKVLAFVSPLLNHNLSDGRMNDKINKMSEMISANDFSESYIFLQSHWLKPEKVVRNITEIKNDYWQESLGINKSKNLESMMMLMDMVNYLPDDILTKVDRASMGVSLESRVPLLDHRIVEFAWRLPMNMKIRKSGGGKWILRKLLNNYVPSALVERPKMGFGVPLDIWLRKPLRDWAENLLQENKIREEGFFHPEPIRQKWEEHVSGRSNWQYHLWDILMFQAWLEKHK